MKWSEHTIARAIALQTLARKCVVLVDNCNWTGHECDVLGVTTDLRIIDVEVKISRADLKADAAKDKWWRRIGWTAQHGADAPRTHPRKVWKHYYAMPAAIWRPELVDTLPSKASGILLLREPRGWREPNVVVDCIRRATPNKQADRLTPEQVMDIARLANLRMWEAYKRHEQAEAERRHYAEQLRAHTGGLLAFH
ncbi:MAG: hypothetical protein AB7P94_16705 [Steroidobacteraceae bacterium]